MSFYDGYEFFIWLALILVFAIILGFLRVNLRIYGLIVSILMVLAIYTNPLSLIYITVFTVFELIVIYVYRYIYKRFGRVEWMYYTALIMSLLPLGIYKITHFFSVTILGFLGISYITFKCVQIVIEIYDGLIDNVNLIETIYFLIFFPTLSSGPVDRSRRFGEDYVKKYDRREYAELVGDGLFKIFLGAFYKIVLSALFYGMMMKISDGRMWYHHILYAYCYGIYMFFDFAGYSSMAVGTSYILGVKTPDNFNKPFISVDIKDFWNRWHISLSYWLRDFVFSRCVMKFSKKKWFHDRLGRAMAAYMVNMFIMGVWHGLDISYIIYGIYHGLLLVFNEWYQKKAKFYKKNKDKKWYRILSWFITMQLVMFGFFIFAGRLSIFWR